MTIKVLIVDDSALIRSLLTETLSHDRVIEVVGTATDPYDAREKIKKLNPDVVTLDIEMPHMDGLSFLEKIMTLRPTPVIMVSSLTQKGAEATIRALELGAIDYISKDGSNTMNIDALGDELIQKIKTASKANLSVISTENKKKIESEKIQFKDKSLIAIGASTGGVDAVKQVLSTFPSNIPPTVITQHMPETFTSSFASRLDHMFDFHVKEANHGEVMRAGLVYIAPGDMHMKVALRGTQYVTQLDDGDKVSGHKPSVDVMFASVANAANKHATGAILTGMGKDGADGLVKMKKSGAKTYGQDEASCVVYGMPAAAYKAGAVDRMLPLQKIGDALLEACVK